MPKPPPLLAELVEAIRTLPLEARYLEDDERPNAVKILGLCDHGPNGRLTVNEAATTVETLLHEALHAIRPDWSERTVDRRANNLFIKLTSEEVLGIHKQYLRRVRRVRRKRII